MDKIYEIPKFPGYGVSKDGRIWSRIKGGNQAGNLSKIWLRQMRTQQNLSGHLMVQLRRNKQSISVYVHRLVLETFVGPCPEGMECRHFPDRSTLNCHLNNLQWGTRKENVADQIQHGTKTEGSKNGMAKLTEQSVQKIRRLYDKQIKTVEQIAVIFKMHCVTIKGIVSRKHWKHVV